MTALAGTVVGFAVFLIFYLLGGMGGGDVKLMAGFGALLGAGRLLEAALWTAGVGGIMAVAVLGWKALRRQIGKWMGRTLPMNWTPPHEFGRTGAGSIDSLRSRDCAGCVVIAGAEGVDERTGRADKFWQQKFIDVRDQPPGGENRWEAEENKQWIAGFLRCWVSVWCSRWWSRACSIR